VRSTAGGEDGFCQRLIARLKPEEAEIVYNDDGQPVWEQAGKKGKNGQRKISLSKLRTIAKGHKKAGAL